MPHVFIVSEQTLPVHLRYHFAGTGAKDYNCPYLFDATVSMRSGERLLTGMLADISRLRVGDQVLFYLQQSTKREGMFFGSFKVAAPPFYCDDGYLDDELGKKLIFRVQLQPDEVYSQGITERECLDSLTGIEHPYELCWSLIYRKLKGNRGCTMITDYEFDRIMVKIRQRNCNGSNNASTTPLSGPLDYDAVENRIIPAAASAEYTGQQAGLEVLPRLLYKWSRGNAYESHLQAYIMQHLTEIAEFKVAPTVFSWIGNEVSCGVGMQSIDVLLEQRTDAVVHLSIIELKDEQPVEYIKTQINKYLVWARDYLVPTYQLPVVLHPTIVAPLPKKRALEIAQSFASEVADSANLTVAPLRYLGISQNNGTINFQNIPLDSAKHL